ncbi:nucleotide exchange factor GrpE [Haloarchaeobius salinus]|uniref:nucleotide exchange factor GrpE n=1 Tax=Haloarchaeobius salinus TaxID=1198298 RepID=UPI00210D8D83|nr:nucleotide exchange factor GrpE [Haloarchaeobius salinus]
MSEHRRNSTEPDRTESTTDDETEQADTQAPESTERVDQQAPPGDGGERSIDGDKWRQRLAQLKVDRAMATSDEQQKALTDKIEDLQTRMHDAGVPTDAPDGGSSTDGESPVKATGSQDHPTEHHPSDADDENEEGPTDSTGAAGSDSPESSRDADAVPGKSKHETSTEGTPGATPSSDLNPDSNTTSQAQSEEAQHPDQSPEEGNDRERATDSEQEPTGAGSPTGQGVTQTPEPDASPPSPTPDPTDRTPSTPSTPTENSQETDIEDEQDTDSGPDPDSEPKLESLEGSDTGADDRAESDPTSDAHPSPRDDRGEESVASNDRRNDATSGTGALAEEVSVLQTQLETLETTVDEYRQKNTREHELLRKEAVEQLGERMLRVRDTLTRAIEYNEFDDDQAAMLEAVVTKFDQQFTAGAIDKIDPDPGDEVDDLRHALAGPREETTAVPPGCIIRVESPGFEIDGYPLQEAKVIAAKRE